MCAIDVCYILCYREFLEVGYLLNNATKLSLHTVMLFAVILAFTQTIKLDINEHSMSILDDVLLFVCVPAFVMETVFSLIATLTIINVVKSIDFCVMVRINTRLTNLHYFVNFLLSSSI